MANIINAIYNLAINTNSNISETSDAGNRVHNAGVGFETYIKDMFANTFGMTDSRKKVIWSKVFSYLGNANNPPDSMLLGGDALEMKKLETIKGCIALNSSYPKQKLFVTDTRISKACVEAENWTEKDIIYAVGTVEKSTHILKALFLVYGRDYCASKSCYEKLIGKIKTATQTAEDINFEQNTNELAHINKVDPLGRTYMRVRGMWGIENPWKVFESENIKYDVTKSFNMVALIPMEKWNSFDNIDLIKSLDCITLQQIAVCDPDNPANLNQSILVKYTIR